MKILVVDPADFFGGAEYFTLDILQELHEKNDIEFCILSTGKSEKYMNLLPENIQKKTIDLPRLRPFRPIALLQTLRKIKKIIDQFQPDILHSNSVRAGIFCSFFPKKNWTHFSHDFTTPKFFAKRLGKAKKIFSCSQVVKQDLIQKGISAQKIKVIPNGIHMDFSPLLRGDTEGYKKIGEASSFCLEKKSGCPSDSPRIPLLTSPQEGGSIISLVGRIDIWKGQDIFVQAAELLQKDLPNTEFRIYGEANTHDKKTQDFEKKLRDFVTEKNVKNIVFCGQETREKIFSETDIIVHASTKPEPFGRTVLEALAFGVPVLASDDGGVREILAGNDFAEFRVEPNNPRELAKKILFLVRNTKLQEKFKTLASQRAQAFDIKKIAAEIEKEWKRIA
jgi:glycosyltransferase involved in cell wall biosynthesis